MVVIFSALLHVLVLFQGCACVYFTEKRPLFCLHADANVGTSLGRLIAHSSAQDNCSLGELQYDVFGGSGSFSVNTSGWLRLDKPISNSNKVGDVIPLTVKARCTMDDGSYRDVNNSIEIEITQALAPGTPPTESQLEDICYHSNSDTIYVEENKNNVTIGTVNRCFSGNGVIKMYKVNKPKAKFVIDQSTSEIRLLKPLDRETLGTLDGRGNVDNITGIQPLRISCTVTSGGTTFPAQKRNINVKVQDVNDSPPVFTNYKNIQYLEKNIEIMDDVDSVQKIVAVVLDADTWRNNTHQLQVISDPKFICKSDIMCLDPKKGKSICRFQIELVNLDRLVESKYSCEVRLVDTTFIPQPQHNYNNSATIVVNIHKRSTLSPPPARRVVTQSVEVSRDAARLARVVQLRTSPDGVTYSLFNELFKVTKDYGIVYVDNPSILETAPNNMTIHVHGSSSTDFQLLIHFTGSYRQQDKCDSGCSRQDTTATCTSSCGLGLATGNCVMRGDETNSRMSYNYGTCTHSTATCPDRNCDELENMYPSLCPQDCTTEANGAYLLNPKFNPARGIVMAESPCWCEADYFEVICNCMPGPHQHMTDPQEVTSSTDTGAATSAATANTTKEAQPIKAPTKQVIGTSTVSAGGAAKHIIVKAVTDAGGIPTTHYNYTESGHNNDSGQMIALASAETSSQCGTICAVAIGLGLGAFIAISFSLFMLWFTKKKNDRRKSNMKHVGSVVSLTALPSDYLDDADRRVSYSSPQWTPKGPVYSTQSQPMQRPENSKWEVPRDNLTLDQTLGEGEFGLVVKAKALGIDGENTERNVAVKMLKHCSTAAEEQDLWSEFNLLKDVSHPNVIRLLGVCTGEGPFYVIVEYCEHGCLLNYLRRSRLEENGYINQRVRYRYRAPENKVQTDSNLKGDLLSMRDLLSFAWQIAKGMSYLSSIKLVHRDLAARNVLVSSGRLLKISDFGLTRDVYEADTYLKKSRGRIPVKWLAPESLYAQIYTTKSDVWSYGIVLWELVTLGAPPYPGIPPERLYNLLIGGYRMDRPENCQDEMYAVMQKCWKTDAGDRPSFNSLAEIFDRILQEKTGYLDLNSSESFRNNLYRGCFGSTSEEGDWTSEHSDATDSISDSDKIDDINLKTVCNSTYLTPSCELRDNNSTPLLNNIVHLEENSNRPSPNRRKQDSKGSDKNIFRKVTDMTYLPPKQSKSGHIVHPAENMSLLIDSGKAKFVNLPESMEDEQTRVTLEC